jgi:hypothetical protein
MDKIRAKRLQVEFANPLLALLPGQHAQPDVFASMIEVTN